MRNPRKNKGTAFSFDERKKYGLEGLLPYEVESLDTQMLRINRQLDMIGEPIHKYSYLSNLLETNETLYFNLIMNDPAKFLPLVYTLQWVKHAKNSGISPGAPGGYSFP
ncbi:MAG: hypothetical protein U0Z17_11595 [Bacteroidales bacterium]